MKHDVLQAFLTARLFDVKGDDQLVEKLRQTGDDLATAIKAAPHRAAAFTMVAIDGEVDPAEPLLTEVIRLLEKRSNSYASVFADDQLPVVARAVIFDALAQISTSDTIALAVTMTARNLLPRIGSLRDRELWTDLLADIDGRLEARARREWALPSAAATRVPSFTRPQGGKLTPVTVRREWLQPKIEAASGPNNQNNEALSDANPQWSNSGPAWSHDFAPRISRAIADAIDAVAKKMTESINDADFVGLIGTAVNQHVTDAANAMTQTAAALERRTSMLWWKESLYSTGAKTSYRDMDPVLAAGWIAVDAVDQTGAFAPRMAEAFLSETVRSLPVEQCDKTARIADIAERLARDDDQTTDLRSRLATVSPEVGMSPLAGLLGVAPQIDRATIARRVGLADDMELATADLALWLYRDLQVAVGTAGAGKPRRRAKS